MSLGSCISVRGSPARGLLGTLVVLTALATPAMAGNGQNGTGQNGTGQNGQPQNGNYAAPEIDPGSMLGGATLLIGVGFILADRRCRSQSRVGPN